MSLFTSKRERRLWLSALAVVAAIYATLGLAGTLAEVLRGHGLLGAAFGLGFLLAIATTVGIALQRRPARVEVWVALGVATVYGMIVVRMGIGPAERTHLFEYGLVAVLILMALTERAKNGRHVPAPAIIAIVATALIGWLDEGIQALLPNRVYDIRDVGVNALAGLLATVAMLALSAARRWAASAGEG